MVDYLHRRGVGVILDFVLAHFPTGYGLALQTVRRLCASPGGDSVTEEKP